MRRISNFSDKLILPITDVVIKNNNHIWTYFTDCITMRVQLYWLYSLGLNEKVNRNSQICKIRKKMKMVRLVKLEKNEFFNVHFL
jgi:hypothetical protein